MCYTYVYAKSMKTVKVMYRGTFVMAFYINYFHQVHKIPYNGKILGHKFLKTQYVSFANILSRMAI